MLEEFVRLPEFILVSTIVSIGSVLPNRCLGVTLFYYFRFLFFTRENYSVERQGNLLTKILPLHFFNISMPVRHYAITPLRHYTSTPVCQYASTPVHQYASTPVRQYASMSVCQYTIMPVRQYVSMPVRHYTSTPVRHYASTLVRQYAITPVCQYASMPVFHYTFVSTLLSSLYSPLSTKCPAHRHLHK